MAQNVLGRPNVHTSTDRNGFDMSALQNFSSHAGLLNLCMAEFVPAGTKGKINRKVFTRSAQVAFPAFNSVREYFDFFKVPMRYLLSIWNDWKLNTNDINSSALLQTTVGSDGLIPSAAAYAPRINLASLLDNLRWTGANSSTSTKRVANNYYRLLDAIKAHPDIGGNNVINLFKVAAYQKVYYDHYRNTAYESNDPFAYNLDWLYTDQNSGTLGLLDPTTTLGRLTAAKMFTMRYVNFRNDFFHNIYPSLNYTLTSNLANSGLNWTVPTNVQFNLNSAALGTQYVTKHNSVGGQTMFGSSIGSSNVVYSTVQQVRAAFALDKLLRASAYAPKHVREQFKAQFGVDISNKIGHESDRLGSFVSTVDFGEVTQVVDTAASGSPSNLGSVGGKGVGSSDWDKDISYYADEDSIIIGLHYFIPTAMYDVTQDQWNEHLTREDFYSRMFENLGLRPIYERNLFPYHLLNNSGVNIIGFTEPYLDEKVGQDLNTGIFKESFEYVDVSSSDPTKLASISGQSPLYAFTTHVNNLAKNDTLGASGGVTYEYFKVDPTVMDSIFAQNFDGTPLTDQFYGLIRIKHATVKPMSVHGQPSL